MKSIWIESGLYGNAGKFWLSSIFHFSIQFQTWALFFFSFYYLALWFSREHPEKRKGFIYFPTVFQSKPSLILGSSIGPKV